MDDNQNLAWASEFNYQKIVLEGSVPVNIPAFLFSPTVVATITFSSPPKQFRLRVEYNGKRGLLARVPPDLLGTGASLYAYVSGNNIVVECDNSSSAVTINIRYRVYLDG